MKVNSNYVKLTGKAELDKPLQVGKNYTITNSGAVISETIKDNDDGTVDKMFTFRVIQTEITNELGDSIKAKDTRSNSTLLRGQAYAIWRGCQLNLDFETFYTELCHEYMSIADVLATKIINKYEKN